MQEAVFRLSDLSDLNVQDVAREAWDSGNYTITVDGRPAEEEWRYDIEQWLINHGVVYTRLVLA